MWFMLSFFFFVCIFLEVHSESTTDQLSEALTPLYHSSDWTLLLASMSNDVNGVKNALELGADVNAQGSKGLTALQYACMIGSPEIVKVLLDTPDIDVNKVRCGGDTALYYALGCRSQGNIECARLLVNHKDTDANSESFGRTPLQTAISTSFPFDIIEQLLLKTRDFWSEDKCGYSPIAHAIIQQSFDVYSLLRDHGANLKKVTDPTSLLLLAVRAKDPRFIIDLVERGANVHATDERGQTAIFAADSISHVRELVRGGADVNLKDKFGWTPLMAAAYRCSLQSIRALVLEGAELEKGDGQNLAKLCKGKNKSKIKGVIKKAQRDAKDLLPPGMFVISKIQSVIFISLSR